MIKIITEKIQDLSIKENQSFCVSLLDVIHKHTGHFFLGTLRRTFFNTDICRVKNFNLSIRMRKKDHFRYFEHGDGKI